MCARACVCASSYIKNIDICRHYLLYPLAIFVDQTEENQELTEQLDDAEEENVLLQQDFIALQQDKAGNVSIHNATHNVYV